MGPINPGCAGERSLLLSPDGERIHEVYNDVARQSLFQAGWIDVTGSKEHEDRCTQIRNEGATLR